MHSERWLNTSCIVSCVEEHCSCQGLKWILELPTWWLQPLECSQIIHGYEYSTVFSKEYLVFSVHVYMYVPHGCATSVPLRNRISRCITGHPVAQPAICFAGAFLWYDLRVSKWRLQSAICSRSMHTVKDSVNGRRTYRRASETAEQREGL